MVPVILTHDQLHSENSDYTRIFKSVQQFLPAPDLTETYFYERYGAAIKLVAEFQQDLETQKDVGLKMISFERKAEKHNEYLAKIIVARKNGFRNEIFRFDFFVKEIENFAKEHKAKKIKLVISALNPKILALAVLIFSNRIISFDVNDKTTDFLKTVSAQELRLKADLNHLLRETLPPFVVNVGQISIDYSSEELESFWKSKNFWVRFFLYHCGMQLGQLAIKVEALLEFDEKGDMINRPNIPGGKL